MRLFVAHVAIEDFVGAAVVAFTHLLFSAQAGDGAQTGGDVGGARGGFAVLLTVVANLRFEEGRVPGNHADHNERTDEGNDRGDGVDEPELHGTEGRDNHSVDE